jgi:transcriptional regulator with XRE-family HTH domain
LFGGLIVPKINSAESIGQRISRLRKDRGMTQKELADVLAVSQPVISDYENDVIRIHADMLIPLSQTLNTTADELLGLKPEGKSTDPTNNNRRLLRRLKEIDKLSKRDQEALFRTIDAFLSK